jgi:hypothetical protein
MHGLWPLAGSASRNPARPTFDGTIPGDSAGLPSSHPLVTGRRELVVPKLLGLFPTAALGLRLLWSQDDLNIEAEVVSDPGQGVQGDVVVAALDLGHVC